ncbi:MAG TPA: ATP synthase F1 subunit gamma [Candidatus Saccharimonadales bacterium]|nr:ATP synthase F1 subunit gamma [Candidatus Saccharimonadales bacterium]
MANTTALKRRIGSVKNTRQITKAMELVAASKMKKAQGQALATREYRESAKGILGRLSTVSDVSLNRMFLTRPIKEQLLIIITSDLGLAGGYDGNVIKEVIKRIEENDKKKIKTNLVAIGRKGGQFFSRVKGLNIASAYSMFSQDPSPADIRPIILGAIKQYEDKEIDQASIIYTKFISNIKQEVKSIDVLPAKLDAISSEENDHDKKTVSELEVAIFEPNIDEIVEDAVLRLIEVQLWQAVLEALASEYSMRMVAMKNASDNANDIIDDLTLEYNTARQASITQEIAEIVGGAEAVKQT